MYIVTIQYIFVMFGICYTAIICMLVLEIIIVYVYFLKKTTKHTHTHTFQHKTSVSWIHVLLRNVHMFSIAIDVI